MTPRQLAIIEQIKAAVAHELFADASGHDWWHAQRVHAVAAVLAEEEGADRFVVACAALLHDISDYKLNGGDHRKGPETAARLLDQLGCPEEADRVATIIGEISYEGAGGTSGASTLEAQVVQDADRLDAIGAIGIARAFAFGGAKGHLMHVPGAEPVMHASRDEYLARTSTTVNHFYEKLLLLVDRMNTPTARRMGERRQRVMQDFLAEFLREWDGQDLGGVTP